MNKSDYTSTTEACLIVLFRVCVGWMFLWAGIHHFGDDKFVYGFLSHSKTFNGVFAPLTQPPILAPLTFLVEYGHLAIGLSMVSGLFVRLSLPFACLMMLSYWPAHMDFPYVDSPNNFLIDYHIVYAGLTVYLYIKKAGHVFGLDWVAARLPLVQHNAALRWAAA